MSLSVVLKEKGGSVFPCGTLLLSILRKNQGERYIPKNGLFHWAVDVGSVILDAEKKSGKERVYEAVKNGGPGPFAKSVKYGSLLNVLREGETEEKRSEGFRSFAHKIRCLLNKRLIVHFFQLQQL